MNVKNIINVFLVLVLVSGGIYFVVGDSDFLTPANNITYISGNYTVSVRTSDITDVVNVTFYYLTNNSVNRNYSVYNVLANVSNSSSGNYATAEFTFNTHNFTGSLNADGNYTIAAAFLYGTEKASPVGYIQKMGYKIPVGGFTSGGGRIRFSDVLNISIK